MPDTSEVVCRTVSGCSRTVESHCGAAGIACHCRGESNVLQTVNCAHIIDVLPRLAVVIGCRYDCVGATGSTTSHCTTGHCKIDSTVIIGCYGWILEIGVSAGLIRRVLNRTYVPRQPIVLRDYDGSRPTAAVIGKINRSFWRYFHVAVQSAALRCVGCDWRTEGGASVIAAQTKRSDQILRAIINGVRVWAWRRSRRMIWPAADRLMVNARSERPRAW